VEGITIPASSQTATPPAPATGEVTNDGKVTRVQVSGQEKPADQQQQKPAGERPAWLPEKFKTPEELAASYKELETKLGQGKKEETPAAAAAATPTNVPTITKELPQVDMGTISAEYAKNGKLSDETYRSLAGKGFSKEVVDAHIAGQQALVEKYTKTLEDSVGGKETLDSIVKWAGANLDDKAIDSINAVLKSGNDVAAKTILAGLKSQYVAAMGQDPSLVNAEGAPGTSGAQPFRSNAEIVTAMRDKRYRTDEAYRQDVAARLMVTNI